MALTGRSPITVFSGGPVLPMSSGVSDCGAVAVGAGRVVAVGAAALALRRRAVSVELDGRTLTPGLIDSHVHLAALAADADRVQLIDCRSIGDVQERLRHRADRTAPGQWITAAAMWHEGVLRERRPPTRWELDEVSVDHPIYLARGGHVGVANSRALELAGIVDTTPDPPSGVIVRDAAGRATGQLLEHAKRLVTELIPTPPDRQRLDRALEAQMRRLRSFGVTAVLDPGVDEPVIESYRRLDAAGRAPLRASLLFRFWNLDDVTRALDRWEEWNRGADRCRVVGMKFAVDGGIEGAFLRHPYELVPGEQERPGYRGIPRLPPGGLDELRRCLRLIAGAGLPLQIHAVGDAAIDVVNELLADVAAGRSLARLRWGVCHDTLASRRQLEVQRDLGLFATMQGHPVLLSTNILKWWGEERAEHQAPTRSMLDVGLLVAGGTDAPAAPLDPRETLAWMVDRRTIAGHVLGSREAISVREALASFTTAAAHTVVREHEIGALDPGRRADLAIWEDDPRQLDGDGLRTLRLWRTYVDGIADLAEDPEDADPPQEAST